jgi:multidrug efflux pump subunit AcrB
MAWAMSNWWRPKTNSSPYRQTSPYLRNVRTTNQDDRTQLNINIDDKKAVAQQINTADVNRLLSDALGGDYVNDFIHNGRVKRVYVQGDAPYRMLPENIGEWKVRNALGQMVPLSSFTTSLGKWRRRNCNAITAALPWN